MNKNEFSMVLEPSVKEEILDIVLTTARKLSDPLLVKEHASGSENQIMINGMAYSLWSDLALSHGYPGLCIVYSELDHMFPNDGWDSVGHEFLLEIQKAIEEQGVNSLSTFGGLAGLTFAVESLSRNGTRYQNFLKTLIEGLTYSTQDFIEKAQKSLEESSILTGDYDVIQGLSGIGRYLINKKNIPMFKTLIKEILEYMVELTRDVIIHEEKVPGWFIASEKLFLNSDRKNNPIGNFNCGLSHGIAGPLALLSISLQNGIEVGGQREAIKKIGDWLINFSMQEDNNLIFPGVVSWEEQCQGRVQNISSRDAWCYGTLGVARALFLAGKSIGNQYFIEKSIQSFEGIYRRSEASWNIHSPTFCHGYSGLLHITKLMNSYLKSDNLDFEIKKLVEKLVKMYKNEYVFGFKDIENIEGREVYTNKPGFLDGTAGILLVLLHLYNDKNYTGWDELFLLK
ncbi:Nisin biosynthesis protein NisC [Bacillus cereus]|nr:Nisin biosynthesis protein NisC [Bacillus cereus]